jgi:phosphotransacetylase
MAASTFSGSGDRFLTADERTAELEQRRKELEVARGELTSLAAVNKKLAEKKLPERKVTFGKFRNKKVLGDGVSVFCCLG